MHYVVFDVVWPILMASVIGFWIWVLLRGGPQ
jgi:hypothetical protein